MNETNKEPLTIENYRSDYKLKAGLLIFLTFILSGCFQSSAFDESPVATMLNVQNMKILRETNETLLEEVISYDEMIGDSTPSYVYDFSASKLKNNYNEALNLYRNYERGIYSIQELSERLYENEKKVISSIFDPMKDESYSIHELLNGIRRTENLPVEDLYGTSKELRQLFLRTMLCYNRLFRIGLRYLQDIELKKDSRFPIMQVIKEGDEDLLGIYVGSFGNNPSEQCRLRVEGKAIDFHEGKGIVNLTSFAKDSILIGIEVESEITGIIELSEAYYVKK